MFEESSASETSEPETSEVARKTERRDEVKFDVEALRRRLRERFGSTKDKGWIQFEESLDPTGQQDEDYRLMAFYVPEDEINDYEHLLENSGFGKDEVFDDPNEFPAPGKYIRFTYPKHPYGVKRPDDGFMIFRVGFKVSG